MAFPRARTLPELFDVIAPIAEQFQTALIQIIDPQASGTWIPYDPETDNGGYWEPAGPVYEGQARVQQLSDRDNNSGLVYNPTTEVGFRIQIPLTPGQFKIERGFQVKVTSAKDSTLSGYLIYVRSAVNSNVAQVRDVLAVASVESELAADPDAPGAD